MKLLKISSISMLVLTLYSCGMDNDIEEVELNEPIERFDYTQVEKDEELDWIEQYIIDNDINAIKTKSGLHYEILEEGFGIAPDSTDTVIAHFETYNAKTGDTLGISSREENPYGQILEMDRLLEGVREGFLLSQEGTIIRMVVPSFLAYGKTGYPIRGIDPETIIDYIFELNIVLKD